jgi:S1-C subfamily serine protease
VIGVLASRPLWLAIVVLVVWLSTPVTLGAQGPPEMGWLGVSISDVSEDVAERLGAAFGPAAGIGVVVIEVLKDGPAEAARVAQGDVIVKVDTQPIWDVRQLQRLIRSRPVNRPVSLTILRGTSRLTLPVTLAPMPLSARGQLAGERFGFVVRETDNPIAGRGSGEARVVVAFVDPDSPAARAGLQSLDTIIRANDQPVRNLEEFAQAIWRTPGRTVLVVERREAPAPLTVTLELPR